MKLPRIWTNAQLATCCDKNLGVYPHGTLIVDGEEIVFAGATDSLPTALQPLLSAAHDVDQAWITPGLIDCHTHLIFGGDRSNEFQLRLRGATYEQLQAAGGGIFGTVQATAKTSDELLYSNTHERLMQLARTGVTTVEIKSGYGLYPDAEIRLLDIARRLNTHKNTPDIIPTCLAAHALPVEYAQQRDEYIRVICQQLIPQVAERNLCRAIDAFGENIAFTPEEVRTIFECAQHHGLPVKLHADQLSDQNGAAIAAEFNALSADHLEYSSKEGLKAMAAASTVAVLLPGAFYYLGETQKPSISDLRGFGVPIAVATDANPGSSPLLSLPLAMNMSSVLFGLTVEEAILGVTHYAARALGLEDRGMLKPGMRADFCVWPINDLAELVYWTGKEHLPLVVQHGQLRL